VPNKKPTKRGLEARAQVALYFNLSLELQLWTLSTHRQGIEPPLRGHPERRELGGLLPLVNSHYIFASSTMSTHRQRVQPALRRQLRRRKLGGLAGEGAATKAVSPQAAPPTLVDRRQVQRQRLRQRLVVQALQRNAAESLNHSCSSNLCACETYTLVENALG